MSAACLLELRCIFGLSGWMCLPVHTVPFPLQIHMRAEGGMQVLTVQVIPSSSVWRRDLALLSQLAKLRAAGHTAGSLTQPQHMGIVFSSRLVWQRPPSHPATSFRCHRQLPLNLDRSRSRIQHRTVPWHCMFLQSLPQR